MDRKDYVIQALTQQRDALANQLAQAVAEANMQIDALQQKLAALEKKPD